MMATQIKPVGNDIATASAGIAAAIAPAIPTILALATPKGYSPDTQRKQHEMPHCNRTPFPNDYANNYGMDLAERAAEIADFQEIAANLPPEALPHLISAIYKTAFNRGEWQEYCYQGLLRDPDFMQSDSAIWSDDQHNELAFIQSRFAAWYDSAVAHRAVHGMEAPPAPVDDGDPGYRLPSGRFRKRYTQ